MKITIYELLGLIKDGKAPKKIKYKNRIFEYRDNDYWSNDIGGWFSVECLEISILNDEIEIIDEEDEFIDIRKLGIPKIDTIENERICRAEYRINDLIKNQKKIIEKLKEK